MRMWTILRDCDQLCASTPRAVDMSSSAHDQHVTGRGQRSDRLPLCHHPLARRKALRFSPPLHTPEAPRISLPPVHHPLHKASSLSNVAEAHNPQLGCITMAETPQSSREILVEAQNDCRTTVQTSVADSMRVKLSATREI